MAWRREKANQSEAPTRVFISAASGDLGSVREQVKQALLTMGSMPIEQSNFPPDYRSVHEMIKHKIADCEAVIHIVGHRYGTEPDPATLPDGALRRSYTQMEADIAHELGKKLYVFVCPEDFPYDEASPEDEELQALQDAYRAEVFRSKIVRTKVADRDELDRKVRELQIDLDQLKETLGRERRRQALLITELRRDVKSTHRGIEDIGEGLIALQRQLQQGGLALSDLTSEAIYKQLGLRLNMSQEEVAGLIVAGKQSKDLSEQAAAALAALEFGKAESLYLQAAAIQEQNLLKASRDFVGGARAAYLNSRYAEAANYLQRADGTLASAGGRENIPDIWFKLRDLWVTVLWQNGTRADPAHGMAALQKSLQIARETLSHVSRNSAPQDWAEMQNNLGDALKELGKDVEQCAEYLAESAAAYRAALEIYSREESPINWAITQHELGGALWALGTRSTGEKSAQYLRESLAAYHCALEVRTRDQFPVYWALTQVSLGNTLQELGKRSSGEQTSQYLEQSIAAYRDALEVFRSNAKLGKSSANAQHNLGTALQELGSRTSGQQGTQFLEQSVAAYRACLEVYNRDQWPRDWAMTQNNLGNVLQSIGASSSGEKSIAYLEQSVAAYRAALETFSREYTPQQWATTQNNLGTALLNLAMRGTKQRGTNLRLSAEAHSCALGVFTREQLPHDWAMTYCSLGNTFQIIGTLRAGGTMGKESLEMSAQCYCSALEVLTCEQSPQQWAQATYNLGVVLEELSKQSNVEDSLELLRKAVALYNAALTIIAADSDPDTSESVRRHLSSAQALLRERSP